VPAGHGETRHGLGHRWHIRKFGERFAVEIASSRTFPLRIGSITSEILPKNISTVFVSKA
jgi:hypothetical protein